MEKRLVNNLLYKDLSYQVQGAAIEVRKDFGPGHKEVLYQKAFAEELKRRNITFEKEKAIKVYSPKDGKYIGLYRPDFIIDKKIIVEMKAESFVRRDEIKRIYDYLRNSEYELGYFINFASPQLYVKRIIFTNDRKPFYKKLGTFLLVFISLIFVSISGVNAQQNISPSLSVSPHTFDLGVLPGESKTGKIKVGNKSEVALPISARAVDFSANGEKGEMAFDEFSQDISFASRKWIKIDNPNFILNPGETKEVYFTIHVPENAEPGGHYATILFEPKMPSFYFEEPAYSSGEPLSLEPNLENTPVQPRAIPVIGVLFLFSVQTFTLDPEAHQKLEVVEFSVPKEERLVVLENLASAFTAAFTSAFIGKEVQAAAAEITITKKSPSNFILRIKNNDIYHIKPFGKVLIYNIFGRKVGEAEVAQRTILPGKIRQFPIELSIHIPNYLAWLPSAVSEFLVQNFFVGKYGAKVELQTKSPLTAEIFQSEIPVVLTFFSLPYRFWLAFILIFGFLLFFVIKYKKRIKLAFRTLFCPQKSGA